MTAIAAQPSEKTSKMPAWVKIVAKYQRPVISISVWQIINSFGPYLLLTALAYLSLSGPYWITLILAILAGLFLMRVFIIQHDCGHQSFFKSKRANNYL